MFQVYAFDGGTPANYGYIDVTINVQDSNDNAPVFVNSTYHVTLPENFTLGDTFLQVSFKGLPPSYKYVPDRLIEV